MTQKTIRQWTEHIINRFNNINAVLFATSEHHYNCPCIYLKWVCSSCKHKELIGLGMYWCKEANSWMHLTNNEILDIKELIIKKTTRKT